jgi:hypothetical protein
VTRPVRVGQLRPSQLLHTFGIGSVVDLPHISALVQGLDDWDTTEAATVNEPRLLAQVRARLGQQVTALRLPPYAGDDGDHPFADTDTAVGVPVAAFPRWLRCPRCTYLGPISSGLFSLKREPYRPDRVRYEHPCTTQGRPPTAQPVRFLVACRNGHLDDFPWELYAHRGPPCDEPLLELQERGIAGEASNVFVRCRHCDDSRSMVQAFGQPGQRTMPYCRGRHPHLAAFFSCDQQVRTILLGASNLWFADAISVLSIPEYQAPMPQKVADLWDLLEPITSPDVLAYARATQPRLAALADYADAEILQAIDAHRHGAAHTAELGDVRADEWAAFADPDGAPTSDDFRLRAGTAPQPGGGGLDQVVLADRLREVVALTGFTRIDPPGDRRHDGDAAPPAPLTRQPPVWAPAAETRGEGIFVGFPEDAIRRWEDDVADTAHLDTLLEGHRRWCHDRNLPDTGFPGARFILLHTFAHALIRQLALEAGYGAASLRERLYAAPAAAAEPMAGVLIYTAATDSEGTLGGLVRLGEPATLDQLVDRALDAAGLCTADPMCAEHDPSADRSTHGAACHACLFSAETSCERGNRYLDRALLVDTFTTSKLSYFAR